MSNTLCIPEGQIPVCASYYSNIFPIQKVCTLSSLDITDSVRRWATNQRVQIPSILLRNGLWLQSPLYFTKLHLSQGYPTKVPLGVLFCLKQGFHYVAETGLKLEILRSLPLECGNPSGLPVLNFLQTGLPLFFLAFSSLFSNTFITFPRWEKTY